METLINYLEILWVFFITNILGYGGGPATIPLIQHEVVDNFGWMSDYAFIEMLAAGNALPGPIATKMAASIGFMQAGFLGTTVALIGTVVPSLVMKILLMNFLMKHKNAPQIKRMSLYIKPTVATLLLIIVVQNFATAYVSMGIIHLLLILGFSFYFLHIKKAHPTLVILGALIYGGIIGGFGLI